MYRRILVCTDGSELSGKAVDHAIALARIHGADLVALKVTLQRIEDHWDGQIGRDAVQDAEQDKHRADISASTLSIES